MKRIFGIINLLLCLELILGPAAPQLSFLFSLEAHAQQSCPAGTEYNSTLNRCLTTEQTTSILNAVASCGSGDKACYKANAEEALKKAEEEGKIEKSLKDKGGLLGSGMKAAAVAVPLFMVGSMLFRGKNAKPQKCSSISLYMMLGGGAAIFVGDIWANKQHKKRLKDIRKEWEAKVQPKDTDTSNVNDFVQTTQNSTSAEDQNAKASEAQSEAFEMLAKSEESMAKAAKFKSMVYGIGTLAFGASAVMSLMEHFKLNSLKAAAMVPGAGEPAKVAYAQEYQRVYCSNAVPKGGLAAEDAAAATGQDATGAAAQATTSQGTQVINHSENFIRQTGGNLDSSLPGPDVEVITPSKRFESLIQGHNASMELDSNLFQSHSVSLIGAKDLASLMVLHDSFEESLIKRSSPSIDKYYEYSSFYKDTEANRNSDLLQVAKVFSLKMLEELNPLPSAKAEVKAVGADPAAGNLSRLAGINNTLRAPLTRAAIAGVFTVWAGIMTLHARKQAKVAEARAEYLRSVKDTFNNATGAISCSAQERSNSGNPRCYCYTPEGQRNSQRTNSDICNKLWTGKSILAETNYLNSAGTVSQKVCITNAGIDENCACRSNNTCLSAIPNNFSGINPGSLSMLSNGLAPFTQVTTGQLGAGAFNGSAAVSNAVKMLDQARKMASQEPGLLAQMDKTAADAAKQLTASSAGFGAPSLGGSESMPNNMSPSQAAAELEKEFKKADMDITKASGGGTFADPGGNGSVEKFEFGMDGQPDSEETALAEVMEKKLDYGNSDINSGSDTNLFEVLSNRYQRSGMRRLFDEEGKVPADKPNKSDVTP